MKRNSTEENASKAVSYLLKAANVKATDRTINKLLFHHPDFPQVGAIADTLTELNTPNVTVRISESQLSEIPLPGLAFLNIEGGMFAPIVSVGNDRVTWMHTTTGLVDESINSFLGKWGGVVSLIEPHDRSGEIGYMASAKIEFWHRVRKVFLASLLLAISIVIGVGLLGNSQTSLLYQILPLLALCMAGVVVSSLLVWQSLDSSNQVIRKVCNIGTNTSCDNILRSGGANLFGVIPWADTGLVFFSGLFLIIVVAALTNNFIVAHNFVFILFGVSLPYTFYSVIYQWLYLKSWCPLCLVIQLLLWIGFFITLSMRNGDISLLSMVACTWMVTVFAIIVFLWILVRPLIVKSLQAVQLESSLQKIKFDPAYIKALDAKRRILPPIFTGMKVGRMGDPSAPHSILLVTNPTCSACAILHRELFKIVSATDQINVKIVFAISAGSRALGAQVASAALAQHEEDIASVMHDWFNNRNNGLEKWLDKLEFGVDDGLPQLDFHMRWVELANVNSTPFIFLDGIELPRIYDVNEVLRITRVLESVGSDQVK